MALERDSDFDEAARDWRAAMELVAPNAPPPDPRRRGMPPERGAEAKPYLFKDEEGVEHDLRQRLQNAQRSAKQWETQRDHAAVLELPSNLEQLAPEKRCVWLKRQHKKLARKWHPDKARGNKERAARKMREVSEAKEALVKRMSC